MEGERVREIETQKDGGRERHRDGEKERWRWGKKGIDGERERCSGRSFRHESN